MNKYRTFLQAGVMAAGLMLVLITLSGTTRTLGIWLAVISTILFVLDGIADRGSDDPDK